jgi:hypothetical protein
MPFALESTQGTVEFEFSDVPYDSLRELAEQLRAVLDNGLSRAVHFSLEPAEIEFQLDSFEEGRARLTATQWPSDARTTAGQVLLAWEGVAHDLALGFWRGFRHVQAGHFPDGTSPQWNWPFPLKDVELLGRSLGR